MQLGNTIINFILPYSKNMDKALQEIPKLNGNNNLPAWKTKAVKACDIYLKQCYETYQNEFILIRVFRKICLLIGTLNKEYSLIREFKDNLLDSKSIEQCYDVVSRYSGLNENKTQKQFHRVQDIFDGLTPSLSAAIKMNSVPVSSVKKTSSAESSESGKVSKNTITESNADFQHDPDKEVDQQSGAISWSGNRFGLEGNYEACVDMGTKRREQQDRLIPPYIVESGPLKGHIFTASFDGHGSYGGDVASQVAAHFSKEAMSKITDGLSSDARLSDTFFKEPGRSLESDCEDKWWESGSTMSLLQITPEGKLHTYTLGDSRTMFFQNGACKFSTIDMSVNDGRKACDIVKAMGLKSTNVLNQSNEMKRQIAVDLASGNTRHKHFTDKYGTLSADRLAEIYAYHCQKFTQFDEAKLPVCYLGNVFKGAGWRVGGRLAVSSSWGDRYIFGEVKDRFSPLVQTFDLKELDAGAPLQILIGSDGIMDPFNADQLANYLKEDKNHNLKDKLVKLVSDAKEGTASTKKSRDNISLTLMELRMSMPDK